MYIQEFDKNILCLFYSFTRGYRALNLNLKYTSYDAEEIYYCV